MYPVYSNLPVAFIIKVASETSHSCNLMLYCSGAHYHLSACGG